ncbi:YqgE/AlgH family protein [Candidatus Erwinia haradaeae]|uniref:UPF0301 protein ERCICURV3402_216 n=1 Tax=Candidatus Erwinia haradaeae TaxID=1922217 RepID=A0A451D7V0_9GAMM|nr:YqgE/AlgH family protein [Candidatus Erwinia haradaeae]VFP81887.1 UPF0301 protein YqgE [Candidatus Erwinia haradaeae]
MNLQNNFLIAMPTLQNPFFKRAVVYIFEHNSDGAMGLIINKPIDNFMIEDMLKKLKIEPVQSEDNTKKLTTPVFAGGPLAEDRGFILHSAQKTFSSSIQVSENTVMTTSRDVLETLGTSEQPENILIALGCCAWGKGPLEQELMNNAWLTTTANTHVLFNTPIADRWRAAAKNIGVDIYNIVSEAGHA